MKIQRCIAVSYSLIYGFLNITILFEIKLAFSTKLWRNSWHLNRIMFRSELCCMVICEPVELLNLNTDLS